MEGKNNKLSFIGKNRLYENCYDEIIIKIPRKFVGPKFHKKIKI